jgi:hypothetical protein
VNFTDRNELKKRIKPEELLPSFGGTRTVETDAWIEEMKDFYDSTWIPFMSHMKVAPPPNNYKYWNPSA